MKTKLRRHFAILLAAMVLLSALPAAAMAADAGGTDPASQDGEVSALEQVQGLIDALPETVTEENRADVEAKLAAIDQAKQTLTEADLAALDVARYETAAAALAALDAPAGDPAPENPADTPSDDAEEPDDGAETPAPENTETPAPEDGEAPAPAQQVQGLIDALPETVTEENRADVEAQLAAIDQAKLALTDDERAMLDVTRYNAAVAALSALDGQAGEDVPMPMAFDGADAGDGTADDPYQIGSAEQLKAFRDYIISDEGHGAGQYFKLTASIDLGGQAWSPIGGLVGFAGVFDGGGHTVSGLNVTGDYAGLFGLVRGGTIENLGVAGTVAGGEYTGGIAAYCEYDSTIRNCHSSVTVSGSEYTGGIVGFYEIGGTISGCYNTGTVTGGDNTGGIAGSCQNGITISSCYNTGTVTGGKNTGGIAGHSDNRAGNGAAKLSGCYNTGAITGSGNVGGILGENETAVENCYYLAGTAAQGIGSGGSGAAEKTAEEFLALADALGGGWENDALLGRPVLAGNREVLVMTADHPFEIPDKATLERVRDYINGGHSGAGQYFKLTADIDLGGGPWTPIGMDSSYPFCGAFDGGGHTVSGLNASGVISGLFGYVENGTIENLNVSGTSTGDEYAGGIVGRCEKGTIQNCRSSVTVSGGNGCGGIAGYSAGDITGCENTGTVTGDSAGGIVGLGSCDIGSCRNTGPVTGNSCVGGMIGITFGNDITGCHNTGPVTGSDYVGGIAGQADCRISGCYNTGSVSGGSCVGGIAGASQTVGGNAISDCYNTGAVSGGDRIGGILGENEIDYTVENCYNTGAVTGSSYTGSVVGGNYGTVNNCYYLAGTAGGGIGYDRSGTGGAAEKTAEEFLALADALGSAWEDDLLLGRPVLKDNREAPGASAEQPFEIPDKATLEKVRDYINGGHSGAGQYFKLTADIDLGGGEWTPIGVFAGVFDGGGHAVSGLSITTGSDSVGLFSVLSIGGTVKDLTVSGSVTGGENVGGIVGCNEGGTIKNCVNEAIVTGSNNVGGIVGYTAGDITGCENTGTVTGAVTGENGCVGGIVGAGDYTYFTISGCVNSGRIGVESTNGMVVYGGGIIGDIGFGTVESCQNKGDISANGVGHISIGGIAGNGFGNILYCRNDGTVTLEAEEAPGAAGGIIGWEKANMARDQVVGCCNTGDVTSNRDAGGIAGAGNNIKNCYNTGSITGAYAGGIVGDLEGAFIIESCYNVGHIASTDGDAGGMIGVTGSGGASNCCYLDTCGAAGDGTPKTAEQFASGEVAWLLQTGQEAQVWGQTVGSGVPELTDDGDKTVYQITGEVQGRDDIVWYTNNRAALPVAPEKAGYTFAGWSTERGGSVDFTAGTTVSADMTVYAVFTQTSTDTEPPENTTAAAATPPASTPGDTARPTATPAGGVPDTGDPGRPGLWAALLVLSLAGLGALAADRKRSAGRAKK